MLPDQGPATAAKATAAKATFKKESEGAGKTPPHPHKELLPLPRRLVIPEIPLGDEHLGLKVSIPLEAFCPGSLNLGNAQVARGWF